MTSGTPWHGYKSISLRILRDRQKDCRGRAEWVESCRLWQAAFIGII